MAKRLKILIVDDNSYARQIAAALLEKLGITDIVQADGGASAVGAILAEQPDLILLDWYMPDVNGAGLLQIIRDPRFGHAHLPCILMTGYASRENVARARELGINDLLIKPFSTAQLAAVLRRVLPGPFDAGASSTGTDGAFFV